MTMQFDPDHTAVIVVDMQNGFCHPDGALYAPGSESAISPIRRLIETARESDTQIVFTRDVHPISQFDDAYYYDEFDRWGEHVVEGTWESEIVDELPVRERDHVVVKHTYDAFYQTELHGWLTAHQITDLLICGTLANVCVLHTAGSAGLRDYRPVLVTDAIGSLEDEHKTYALEHADWLFGETTTRDQIEFVPAATAD